MEVNKIYTGDSKEVLKTLTDNSVHCIVTSPPYYGLRDYGMDGQMGLEETPQQYIDSMVELFRECKRVLRDDGTLWVNIGDSYAGSGKGRNADGTRQEGGKQGTSRGTIEGVLIKSSTPNCKQKDLIGIPWMLAFALRADGWYLRQDLIWHKPNPMPESVTDRCTKAHEYIFLLSKSPKYYYDYEAIKQPIADASVSRLAQDIENQKGSDRVPDKTNGRMKAVSADRKYVDQSLIGKKLSKHSGYFYPDGSIIGDGKANKRSVWTVTIKPFADAHFATYPEELIMDCIKAGCPENGIVLDPFSGAGTTALVAAKLNRNYIGIELNPQYVAIAEKRLRNELGIFYQPL